MDDNVEPLAADVGAKAERKLMARRQSGGVVWVGLSMMGLVGWSVVVPTLFGAFVGVWLDGRFPGTHSWTLTLLVAGLVLGCVNAAYWVAREDRAIHAPEEGDDA